MSAPSAIRFLSAADVTACLPPLVDQLDLASETMTALNRAAELPPKVGVHPRPEGAFADAMPALLFGSGDDGSNDRLGMKWVSGVPSNNLVGLPAINAIVVLNDPQTGVPVAVLNGGPITAARTAAISGVAIRAMASPITGSSSSSKRIVRAAIIGAGTQARSHMPILGLVTPGVQVSVFDRHPDRAERLVTEAQEIGGIGGAEAAPSARAAVEGADLILTCASFTTPDKRQVMGPDWLVADAVVVAVDYATICSAAVASDASMFLVDDIGQFVAQRSVGSFDGYPDPTATIGDALRNNMARPEGRVLVSHLGVGLADVVFARAILERAASLGRGTQLDL